MIGLPRVAPMFFGTTLGCDSRPVGVVGGWATMLTVAKKRLPTPFFPRPALRHAMYQYGDLSVVSAAAVVLLNLNHPEDVGFVRAYLNDVNVAEEARRIVEGRLYDFEERGRNTEKLERERQDRIRSGKSWEEWQQEESEQRERAW